MACIINAESGTGLTNSADGSGLLKVQSAGKTTNALAWVNFNGTGTVAIRSSYNVSSITDNGTGDYTVNFATALSDANYCLAGAGQYDTSNVNNDAPMVNIKRASGALSTTGARIVSNTTAGNGTDPLVVCVTFHGN